MHIIHDHRDPRLSCTSWTTTKRAWKASAHRQIENDKEAVIHRIRPRRGIDLIGTDGKVVVPIQIPANLFGRHTSIDNHRVRVKTSLTPRTGMLSTANTVCFITRTARIDSTMERTEHGAKSIDIFHCVDFTVVGPVVVHAILCAEHPESRPVASRRSTRHVGLLNRGTHL